MTDERDDEAQRKERVLLGLWRRLAAEEEQPHEFLLRIKLNELHVDAGCPPGRPLDMSMLVYRGEQLVVELGWDDITLGRG